MTYTVRSRRNDRSRRRASHRPALHGLFECTAGRSRAGRSRRQVPSGAQEGGGRLRRKKAQESRPVRRQRARLYPDPAAGAPMPRIRRTALRGATGENRPHGGEARGAHPQGVCIDSVHRHHELRGPRIRELVHAVRGRVRNVSGSARRRRTVRGPAPPMPGSTSFLTCRSLERASCMSTRASL